MLLSSVSREVTQFAIAEGRICPRVVTEHLRIMTEPRVGLAQLNC